MERCSCLCCFVRVRCTLSRSGGTAQLLPHAYGREGGGRKRAGAVVRDPMLSLLYIFTPVITGFFSSVFCVYVCHVAGKGKKGCFMIIVAQPG